MTFVRFQLFCLLTLTLCCLAQDSSAARADKLSSKILCSCGCREVMKDCSHKQCERKPMMQKTLAAAVQQGKTDDQVLQQMAATFGTDILLDPSAHGFNMLLWIVPVGGAVLALGSILAVQSRKKTQQRIGRPAPTDS